MRVLITGGLGYLGGRLASHLLFQGYNVFLGTRKKLKSIKEPLSDTTLVQIDWSDQASLESATTGMDAVVHAAGMDAQACYFNPTKALEVNGLNTAMLVDAAKSKGVRRFIYPSTVHVYSSPIVGRIDEISSTTNLHPYATSKLAGEKAVLYAKQIEKLQGVVLRLSNGSGHPIFSDTECWHLIMNDLCRQTVEKKELNLYSETYIERNFISMSDVCLGIDHFLKISENNLKSLPYNLCSEKSLSLQELAQLVAERCKNVLSYTPEIKSVNHAGKNNFNKKLHLCTKNSKKTGLILQQNLEQEIDNTLLFCKKEFSPETHFK
jgi:UDP-glucose 4-epimerase